MPGTTVIAWRKSGIAINYALALAVIAWPTVACRRKNPVPPPPPSSTKSQPVPDAQAPPDPTFLVLVWMESTPTGARIVRVSDCHVLGYTPEIIEFHQSAEPVQIRFELGGYIPLTREVSAASDSELKIVLQPIPKKHAPATKKYKGSK
jgi:eukaryotic-like serine/threonine-protein kinase